MSQMEDTLFYYCITFITHERIVCTIVDSIVLVLLDRTCGKQYLLVFVEADRDILFNSFLVCLYLAVPCYSTCYCY